MRKHFLILMLMALLPLAGWAQDTPAGTGDINKTTIYIEPFGYGGFDLDNVTEANPATITPVGGLNIKITDGGATLTQGQEYTVSTEFYAVAEDGKTVGAVTDYNSYTTLPVGKYAVKITGINTYSGSSAYGIFEVHPAILEVKLYTTGSNPEEVKNIEKVYGTSDPKISELEGVTIKAVVKNSAYTNNSTQVPATEITLTSDQKKAIIYTRMNPSENNSENANATADGKYFNATNDNEGSGYSIRLDGLTGDNVANYNISYQILDLKIKQVNLAEAVTSGVGFYNGTDAAQFANTVYNGENRVPALTVTYKNNDLFKNKADALEVGTDYTLSYTYSTTENGTYSPVDAARNAGYYKVFLNGVANGNYATPYDEGEDQGDPSTIPSVDVEEEEAPVLYGAFQITQAAADVVVMTKTKVYDGKPYTFNEEDQNGTYFAPDFSISGLVPSDEGKVDLSTLTAHAATNVTLNKDVDSYNVVADPTNAKIVYSEDNKIDFGLNYKVTCLPNAWTITPRTLKIKASDVVVNLHATLAATDSHLSFNTDPEVENFSFTTYETSEGAAKIAAAFEIVLAEGASAETAGGPFDDIFLVKRKVFDNDETNNAYTALLANYDWETEGNITNGKLTVKSPDFTIRPLINTNLVYGTKIVPTYYAYAGSGNEITILTDDDINKENIEYLFSADNGVTWTTKVPFDRGTYKAKIAAKENTKIGKGNYAEVKVTTPEVQFAINPKVINITVKEVKLWEGATKTILNKKGKVEPYANQLVTPEGGEQEKINFEYDFVAPADGAKYTVTTNAKTGEKTLGFSDDYTAGKYITIALVDEDGYANDNYVLNVTKGNLVKTTLESLELELDGNAEEVEDAMDITDANEEVTYDVTIKGRKLYANVWNSLVLPFEVKPLEFCNVIEDYAVFNTLTSAVGENVKFSLARTTIPANTPFLVKPTKDIDFDATTTDQDENITRDYIFKGVTIEKGEPIKPVGDAQFIGLYESVSLSEGDGVNVPYSGKFITLAEAKQISGLTAIPLSWTVAYLNITAGTQARITVEEADGTVTAISNINAEGVAVPAEGWYTLNGVKLQGVPTEKGVYINNGKKVVVK